MLLHSVILTNTWLARTQRPLFSTLHHRFSISSDTAPRVDTDCNDFLSWLEHKSGAKFSSALTIGNSSYGKTLYAAENILTGDCILEVPYSVQLAPDNLPPEINCQLGDEVGNVAKLALLILHEKKSGNNSEWAPYIACLPKPNDMHSTIFWSDEELEMIRPSFLYDETSRQKAKIEKDFLSVKSTFDVTLQEFVYAYGLVTARAWESSRGVSMIPFADFLNHSGNSESYVLSDESKRHSEVIADRDFGPGDEVLIKYGEFSNSTLLLDFGFTVSRNHYDRVRVGLNLPEYGGLYEQKVEILDRYRTPSVKDVNEFFTSSGYFFTIKNVKNGSKNGRGIPQSARAFCRVLICESMQELNDLAIEADRSDGRLARYPLKDENKEIEAHQYLLSEISRLIEGYNKHIALLVSGKSAPRRHLAHDLLTGEVRVLKSAAAWLERYCSTLSTKR
ncbi:hypothetical protein CASFOL_007347 [Castilleja foliolosa]|uniref:SET domain-containing protein n=1 Tax=Castilleja foliolosa TaxID=1961234 RepID=A0ABD3ED52_9LAMI